MNLLSLSAVGSTVGPQSTMELLASQFSLKALTFGLATNDQELRVTHVDLEAVQLSHIKYSGNISLQPDTSLDRVFIGIPLNAISKEQGQDRRSTAATMPGIVISPGMDATFTKPDSMDALLINVPCRSLESFSSRLAPEEQSKDLRFNPTMDLVDPAIRSWLRLIRVLMIDLDGPDSLFRTPLLSVQAEQMVIASLIHAQPNSNATAQHGSSLRNLPRTLHNALHAMQSDPRRSWSIPELASLVGISVRTLQIQFVHEFGMGPLAKLQQIRLKNIHRALTLGSPEEVSVTEVAMKWGFKNLGRFAAAYYRAFSEYPSDTLRR
ncbi:AraC family transcriptional regulator [Psychromicrobium sp. YIM B11713]|uniref:AraC family transcriptional regulator n=1 Tax=Psychromicrobium sp. YIM B11713 TaxID=3145233 RepID=UPI00374EC6A6